LDVIVGIPVQTQEVLYPGEAIASKNPCASEQKHNRECDRSPHLDVLYQEDVVQFCYL